VALSALDVGELADDGTISRITGFGALASDDAAKPSHPNSNTESPN
jgi:hypothetical protein